VEVSAASSAVVIASTAWWAACGVRWLVLKPTTMARYTDYVTKDLIPALDQRYGEEVTLTGLMLRATG
jgi:hypothetical protein